MDELRADLEELRAAYEKLKEETAERLQLGVLNPTVLHDVVTTLVDVVDARVAASNEPDRRTGRDAHLHQALHKGGLSIDRAHRGPLGEPLVQDVQDSRR